MARTIACGMAFWFLLFAHLAAAGAQQPGSSSPVSAPALKIDSGDLLEVTMFENPDLSGHFRVDEKGNITAPLIGRVHVQGETAESAAERIESRYVEAQILQPSGSYASVFISEFATQGITVNGEVKVPGVYPALGVRMLNDVLTAAGGVLPTASSRIVITHKGDAGNPVTVEFNPEAVKPLVPQVQIFPGDTIMIPRAGIVYVVGNVTRSGGFVLDGHRMLTVQEAMALAGGGGRAAALKRVQLVRTMEDGNKEMITIPVDQIYKGKAPDVALKDGDILYVPTSTGKLATLQAINSALGIGTQVLVYRTSYQ
jgi:polysaccharide biosynthesis/export protein